MCSSLPQGYFGIERAATQTGTSRCQRGVRGVLTIAKNSRSPRFARPGKVFHANCFHLKICQSRFLRKMLTGDLQRLALSSKRLVIDRPEEPQARKTIGSVDTR